MSAVEGVLGAAVMALGAALQGSVGFGSNLVAAPLLVLIRPGFVPGPVIVSSFLLNVLVVRREGAGAVEPGLRPALVGQVVGVVVAGAVLARLPQDASSLVFAALVLVAVALSAAGWRVHRSPTTLAATGTASAFMGTISGIGGPPIALAYQDVPAATLRATLGRFFLVGGMLSIPAVALAGRLGSDEVVPTLALVPGTIVGFLASGRLRRHLEHRPVRPIVLVLSSASALAVLVRAIL